MKKVCTLKKDNTATCAELSASDNTYINFGSKSVGYKFADFASSDVVFNTILKPRDNIKINFINDEVRELYKKNGGVKTLGSIGYDLVASEDVNFSSGQYGLVPLGIRIKPPKGFYIKVVPRSSTFKRYGLIMANSVGVIDEDYCGPNDLYYFPAIYLPEFDENRRFCLKKGTAIAQAILEKKMLNQFEEVGEDEFLGNKDRGIWLDRR